MDSKMASVRVILSSGVSQKGAAPKIPRTIQKRDVTKKPSLIRSSERALAQGAHNKNPPNSVIKKPSRNPVVVLSLSIRLNAKEGSMAHEKSISSMPKIRKDVAIDMA
jgi:hypothetical protein